jgi:hypothetical protein
MEAAKRKLLEQTHQTILKVGFEDNDYELVADLVSPNFVGFGTALDEKIFGVKDLKALLKRQKEQSRGIDINVEINTLHTHLSENENTAVYIDEGVLSVKTDEEPIEMILRLSLVLEYFENKWLMVHFHSSKPEEVESEKDTWGIENWKEKAEALEKEVAERTADLVLKNRDLAIQAALERVRAKSMAMQSSDEIETIIQVVHDQFVDLGITLDHAGFIIDYKNNDDMIIWLADEHKVIPQIRLSYFDSPHWNSFITAKEKGEKLFVNHLDFKTKNKFYKQIFKYVPELPEDARNFYLKIPSLTIATALIDTIGLYIENFSGVQYQEEDQKILYRFGEEFQQAYTRFLDLQKAEAQAREAQIEAALEKVRSRTMAMQKSEELPLAANNLFLQVQELGIPAWSAGYCIWQDDKQSASCNMSSEGEIQKGFILPSIGAGYDFYTPQERGESFYVKELGGEALVKHYEFMKKLPQVGVIFKELTDAGLELPKFQIFHICYFKYGYVMFITYEAVPESHTVFQRFGKVFEQTYTRFIDLKRAEGQAREAQIEAALERVRSQSMSMQHSEELSTTTQVFHQQLQLLGIDSEFSYLWLPDENEKTHLFWATWCEGKKQKNHYNTKKVTYPLDKSEPSIAACYTAWESGEIVHVNEVKPKEVEDYFNTWTELLGGIDKFQPKLFPDGLYYIDAYMDYGCFGIMIKRKITNDEQNILKRFSKEFQSTYTRFLDLQKAEAQAREAQIEMALERVRSRTMAMQHSDELRDAAQVLFNEVQNLGIPSWSCGYNILSEDKTSAECYMSSEGALQKPFTLYYEKEKSFIEQYRFFISDEVFLVQEQKGKDLEEAYAYMKTISKIGEIITDLEEEGISLPTHQFNHLCKFNKGYLLFITYEPVPEAHDLFKRFTKVFEQTYTRFLDLKRAEAQAREARIETALERVRSRSMGMQSTADFGEVTTEMFNQLRGFGEDLFATGIVFCDKHEGHVEQWHSIPGGGMLSPMIVPIDLDYIHQYRYDQWKAGKELFSIEIPSDFIEQHFEDIFKLPTAQVTLKDLEARNAPMPAPPAWEIDYGASFNKGYILISSLKPLKNTDILPRFAQVFEQAYTRFLDLQKAEEQAREAQIEAALEKVRSRTLAMQKSEELAETSVVVFKELLALGIEPNRLFIGIIKDNGSTIDAWATSEDGSKIEQQFKLYTSKNKSIKEMVAGWKQQKKSTIIDMKGKELQAYFHYLNDVMKIPFIDGLKQKRRVQTIAYFSGGLIGMAAPEEQPEETINLLERFAAVFNLTYTRFNDLKISESQTRKAKIETALERVRARALAMQEPEELKEVASVLRIEMGLLGIEELETCSIYILEDEVNNAECWYALKDAKSKKKKLISDHISMDFTKTWVGQQMLKFYDSEDENTSIAMTGEARVEWIRYCENQSKVLQSYYGEDIPERTYHLQKFSNGAIGAASAGAISEESWVLLKRCASVFSLAYSRFKRSHTGQDGFKTP